MKTFFGGIMATERSHNILSIIWGESAGQRSGGSYPDVMHRERLSGDCAPLRRARIDKPPRKGAADRAYPTLFFPSSRNDACMPYEGRPKNYCFS